METINILKYYFVSEENHNVIDKKKIYITFLCENKMLSLRKRKSHYSIFSPMFDA